MNRVDRHIKILVSGGGTGGHIFPAIAIANEFKERWASAEILFVGAKGRMEMKKVPQAGYPIQGLWISGLQRSLSLENLMFPFKLISSIINAKRIVKQFAPDIAIGTGGYASGPALYAASKKRIPTVIQEQNSYAGITNKLLGKRADAVCVAYNNMDKFFPREKIIHTGNPIRQELLDEACSQEEARSYFDLDPNKKTILIVGGSLGARTFNNTMKAGLHTLKNADYQVMWQMGKNNYETYKNCEVAKLQHIKPMAFIDDMAKAYRAATLVISRAGGAISELSALSKAIILVPSPNVAEDHQTKNAMSLVEKDAAILVKDSDAIESLLKIAESTLKSEETLAQLSENINKLAKPNATQRIVDVIEKLINK